MWFISTFYVIFCYSARNNVLKNFQLQLVELHPCKIDYTYISYLISRKFNTFSYIKIGIKKKYFPNFGQFFLLRDGILLL